jgi:hypothetical protein
MQRLVSITFILLCLSMTMASRAQPGKPLSVIVKFHPLPLFDMNMPVLLSAVEVKYHHWAVQFGYGTTFSATLDDSEEKDYYICGKRYKAELRHYVLNKRRFSVYLGVNFFKTAYHREMDEFQYHNNATGKNYSFTNGVIHKKVHGVAGKGGIIIKMGKRFAFESAPELGIRTVTARFSNQVNLQEIDCKPSNNLNDEFKTEGTRLKPHFGIAVSINYRLL